MTPASAALTALLATWDADADVLDRRGDARGAAMLRQCVAEARAAIDAAADEVLTLAEASLASGMHADTLRHLVAAGRIPNAGKKGAPRIRRGDLPRKPGTATPGQGTTTAGAYDLEADIARLSGRLRAS